MRRIEGRFGQVNDQLTRLLEASAQSARGEARSEGADAPTKREVAAAAAAGVSSEKWKALAEEFPEWAEATEERFAAESVPLRGEIDKVRAEQAELSEVTRIHAAFPRVNWEADLASPEFTAWFLKQPEETRALGQSSRGLDAIQLLDLYYDSRSTPLNDSGGRRAEQIPDDRTRRLQQAAPATRGGTRRSTSAPSDEEDFAKAFYGRN